MEWIMINVIIIIMILDWVFIFNKARSTSAPLQVALFHRGKCPQHSTISAKSAVSESRFAATFSGASGQQSEGAFAAIYTV